MLVLMVVTAAALTVLMVMVMCMLVLMLQLCKLGGKGCLALHRLQQLCTGQLRPRSRNDSCLGIVLTQQCNCGIQLLLRYGIGTGEDNGRGCFNLIIIELAKVFHINLDLTGIHNCDRIAKCDFCICNLLCGGDHIRQLAHAGGFNNDPVRMELINHLLQGLAEVTHQTAADTAGVHLGNVDACLLQEAAVNADLTEFIFDQDQLLAGIGFRNHFLDEGCLARTEKSGININFCHSTHLLCKISHIL